MRADEQRGHVGRLSVLVFAQMLPATLVAPAIRPLFALRHAGDEPAMHAFMSVNMLCAVVAAPLVGAWADRRGRRGALLGALALADALLLLLLPLGLPTPLVLLLRFVEGGAHVGGATLLLGEAAALARRDGDGPTGARSGRAAGRVMGLAGAAIMLAVAAGSALGGLLVPLDVRAPFWCAAALALAIALFGPRELAADVRRARPRLWHLLVTRRVLLVPVAAAFIGRFTIGCLVVTFSLLAHRAHGLSDRAVGLLFTALTLPFALSTYPAARLGQRVPQSLLFGAGALVYAAALLGIAHAPTAGLLPLMIAAGLASALIFASTLCYAARLAPAHERSSAMALVNAAGCLGMVLGPAAAGITASVWSAHGDAVGGYRAVFVLAAGAVCVWFVASTPWLRARARAEWAESI